MILGFTGTRLGPRPAQTAAITRFVEGMKPVCFIHGGASGCDMLAHGIAERCWIPLIEIHPSGDRSPAVWEGMGAHCTIYPALPPLDRNKVIVRRVHGLLACPRTDMEETRSGTWSTVRYARAAGVPVYVILQSGKIVPDKQTFERWIKPL